MYVADKRIKECGSRGLGEDVCYVCTSVQYKCTVYSTRMSLPPAIIDIIQVQIGGCSAGRKQRTCSADDREWSGINMQH